MGQRQNNRETGQRYEDMAVRYLRGRGYEIVRRNYRCPYGEIDVIARDGDTLVFVEVKYRGSAYWGAPWEAVNARKRRRISRAALSFYSGNGYEQDVSCRFDVIGIERGGKITHIENAFDYM